MGNLLEIRDIHTFIGQFHILEGVSAEIPEGSIVAMLGRNGAGKTTTLKSILGLTPPSQGSIIFDGQEIQGLRSFDIANLGVFRAVSASKTVDETLVHLADILRDTVEHYGTPHDFIGHVSDDGFLVITIPETAGLICTTVTDQFNAEGLAVGQTTGLLKLEVNVVSSYDGPFADIRQIAKTLAERRLEQRDLLECPTCPSAGGR